MHTARKLPQGDHSSNPMTCLLNLTIIGSFEYFVLNLYLKIPS